jgi:hypothetical protein
MPPKPRPGNVTLNREQEAEVLRIVADGAIAHGHVGEGRIIPLVILDTTNRADVEEYIRVHQFTEPGDVKCQWGQVFGHDDTVALILSFQRPAQVVAIIEFELDRNHGSLIDQALAAKSIYIQAGREGDRLKHNLDLPKVIVEVPDLGFMEIWDDIYLRHTTAKIRAKGASRADAKRLARTFIDDMRKISSGFRIR